MRTFVKSAIAIAVLGTVLPFAAKAQDIILTKDSQIIKAYVQEINEDSISYKKAENPDGPTYRVSADNIIKISFQNGTEEVFGDNTSDKASSYAVNPVAAGQLLDHSRGDVLLNGRKLSSEEMSSLMPYDIYKQAAGGQHMRNVGKGLMIPGAILMGTGFVWGILAGVSVDYSDYEPGSDYWTFLSLAISSEVIGTPLLSAGVALYCVGNGRIRRAVNNYNEQFASKQYSLNLGSTRNGFGLYLNF